MASRNDESELDDGDLYMMLDGSIYGLKTSMLNCFVNAEGKAATKAVSTIHLIYSEEALASRYTRRDGTRDQLESTHVVGDLKCHLT